MSSEGRGTNQRSAVTSLRKRQAGPVDRYVGARIAAERRMRGLTSDDLGRRLGFSVVQMKKYENGLSRIPVGTLCAVSEILDVPLSRLLPVERGSARRAAERRDDIADKLLAFPDTEFLENLNDLLAIIAQYRAAVN